MGAEDLLSLAPYAVVAALAVLLTALLRTPRLAVEASLRGGTRDGTLYVVVSQKRGWAARGVRVSVVWARPGARSPPVVRELGTLHAGDAIRLEVDELQRLLAPGDAQEWERLEVRVRAWNALPRRAQVPLARRGRAGTGPDAARDADAPAAPAPVQYARSKDLPCPERPDGHHAYEERPYTNDGVVERWRVCRACRHVVREPLTPEQEATQRRVRAARAERLRRQMEDEFARMDEEARARERAERARRAQRQERAGGAPPPSPQDEYPVEVAFFVLDLDADAARWEDVVAAHRRLALAHHPDRHAGAAPDVRAAAERRMQEINAARDRLREHFAPS